MRILKKDGNSSGVGPCGCPISSRVWWIGTSYFAVMNPAAVSASYADIITATTSFAYDVNRRVRWRWCGRGIDGEGRFFQIGR